MCLDWSQWAQFIVILATVLGGYGTLYRKLDDIRKNMVDKHTFLKHNHVGLKNGRIILED